MRHLRLLASTDFFIKDPFYSGVSTRYCRDFSINIMAITLENVPPGKLKSLKGIPMM